MSLYEGYFKDIEYNVIEYPKYHGEYIYRIRRPEQYAAIRRSLRRDVIKKRFDDCNEFLYDLRNYYQNTGYSKRLSEYEVLDNLLDYFWDNVNIPRIICVMSEIENEWWHEGGLHG